ncbi:hypothetical protein EYF80_039378 [Liparis tanakae]|uniref:Uncharacterized protein n=1 Tax=Liparis tanakae TaxID=230148 RepID=A0A4Z2GCT7_9TELE|nr:hypothetical protein EYF80_039378 [Liparis tanakae]
MEYRGGGYSGGSAVCGGAVIKQQIGCNGIRKEDTYSSRGPGPPATRRSSSASAVLGSGGGERPGYGASGAR